MRKEGKRRRERVEQGGREREEEGKGRKKGIKERKEEGAHMHIHAYTHTTYTHRMLVCRGADTNQEDKKKQVPLYLAQRDQAHECQKEILQHQQDRTESLAKQAEEVRKEGGRSGDGGRGKEGKYIKAIVRKRMGKRRMGVGGLGEERGERDGREGGKRKRRGRKDLGRE